MVFLFMAIFNSEASLVYVIINSIFFISTLYSKKHAAYYTMNYFWGDIINEI